MTLKRKHDVKDGSDTDDDIQILGVINDNISEDSSCNEDTNNADDSNDSYASDHRPEVPRKMLKTSNEDDINNNSNKNSLN
jgi:hypothetical protein